jgi:hypothetical protein
VRGTGESCCVRCYKRLELFAKLATSYMRKRRNGRGPRMQVLRATREWDHTTDTSRFYDADTIIVAVSGQQVLACITALTMKRVI